MLLKSILLFNLFIVFSITACNTQIKTNDNSNGDTKEKESQKNIQPIFFADHKVIDLNPKIPLLEKEQQVILSIKNKCLIANIPQNNTDYLFILNKNQIAILDSKGLIKGVKDNNSKKEIPLNTSFGVSGISFASDVIKFKLNKPNQCPNKTIIVGDFL